MKKIVIIITIFFFLFLLEGCTKKKEVDDLIITTAIALDLNEKEEFELSIQILNSHSVGNQPHEASPVVVLSETGRTVQEALRKLATIITGKLFFSHFVILVIGEELAKKGILPYITFFAINQETLHRFTVAIARGCKGKDILKVVTVAEHIPSMSTEGKIAISSSFYGISKYYTNDEVLSDIKSEGVSLTLGSIVIIGDVEKGSDLDNRKKIELDAYTKASTIGIFKDDKLVTWMDEEESLGYNYMCGKIKNSYVVVTKGDGVLATVQVMRNKAKTKMFIEGDKIKFKVMINFEGEIVEDLSGQTSYDELYCDDLLQRAKYEIKVFCEKAIAKAQESKTDIFGFGHMIYRQKYKFWQEIKDKYEDEIFPNIEIEVIVEGEIMRVKP